MIKQFKIAESQIKKLISPMGGCIASDKITVNGLLVGYMCRDKTFFEHDSGWRFFSGNEDQEYIDDSRNSMIYEVNTIANYDSSIIPYLSLPVGTQLERVDNSGLFKIIS